MKAVFKIGKLIMISMVFTSLVFSADKLTLPKNLKWITNDTDPIYADPEAVKGGTYVTYMMSFPLTIRYVGPDSNGEFRSNLDGLRMTLTNLHPNTLNVIPSLATHWAYAGDNKTIYYKLNPKARWSDGKPVTADDFVFTLEMMRSKHIVAPWYNNHFTENFDKVVKYDDYTLAVVGKKPKSKKEQHLTYNMEATPRHFYKLDENFTVDYNWKIPPTAAPYVIDEINKGKYISFKRVMNWWGENEKYFQYRYNVDRVKIIVIRDLNVVYEYFKKGEIDSIIVTFPDVWHGKAKGEIFDKGWAHKLWFYTDSPQPDYGMWLNEDDPMFKDINIRKGFSHAMNIEKILTTVLRGDYQRSHTGDTGKGEYTNKKIRARPFDLKKVDEYMKLAGWDKRGPDGIRVKDGNRFSVAVTYGAPHHTDRLVVLKEEAKKAGIELVLKLMDSSASFKSVQEKQHQVAWSGWSAGMTPAYWEHYHSANAHKPQTNNISNTDNKKLDKLIDTFENEFDDAKKYKLAHEIQQMIYDQGSYIPTFSVPYFRSAYWRYWRLPKVPATKLSEMALEPFGTAIFWLDQKMKDETKAAVKSKTGFPPVTRIDTTFKVE